MIKINYDVDGKVDSIYIQINDYFALIPWNKDTKSIDWNTIDYLPTRESVKVAWDSWASDRDLSVELKDRPDLAPQQIEREDQPDWSNFNKSFLVDNGYLRVVSSCPVSVLISRLETLCIAANQNIDIIGGTWNAIINTLPVKPYKSEISSWNKISSENYMNFHFGNDGTFTIKLPENPM